MARAIAAAAALLCAWTRVPATTASSTLEPDETSVHDAQSAASRAIDCDFSRWHPRRYAAFHLASTHSSSLTIDGKLDERAWEDVPWSEPFQDIRGPRHWSQPWLATRVKLLYDDEFLYVGAFLEEDSVWANVTRRNDVVFHDNDFEVFVDADGSTHNYKELELNAINTTWNLWLDRPYRDGGHENSTRVDPAFGFDMFGKGLRSAAFVPGEVNDPRTWRVSGLCVATLWSGTDSPRRAFAHATDEKLHYWTAEIALPLKQLALHTNAAVPPSPLSYWRINFSRVEWAVRVATTSHGRWRYEKVPGVPEENWVWSSQYAVAMHRPEWWGYLQFRPRGESPPSTEEPVVVALDPEWDVRYLSFQYYYAQHRFFEQKRRFEVSIELLRPYYDAEDALKCTHVLAMQLSPRFFVVRIQSAVESSARNSFTATISSESLIRVQPTRKSTALMDIE